MIPETKDNAARFDAALEGAAEEVMAHFDWIELTPVETEKCITELMHAIADVVGKFVLAMH
jgi:hypothetical protein